MLYPDLLAAVASYAKRGDTGPLAPLWIALAEARLNRELRHFGGLVRASLPIAAEFTPAPADLVAPRSARLVDSPFRDVPFLTSEQMAARRAERRSGTIEAIALIAGQLCVSPAPAQASSIELIYYAALPPLSADAPANWVLGAFPDLYLWGALAEAANFYEDDEQLTKYGALFRDALEGANAASRKAEAGFNLAPQPAARAV
jgi:hypothetical protein